MKYILSLLKLVTVLFIPLIYLAVLTVKSVYDNEEQYFRGALSNLYSMFEGENIRIELTNSNTKYTLRCDASKGIEFYNSVKYLDTISFYAVPLWGNKMIVRQLEYDGQVIPRDEINHSRMTNARISKVVLIVLVLLEATVLLGLLYLKKIIRGTQE